MRGLLAALILCLGVGAAGARCFGNDNTSWYGAESGARTANGEAFRPDGMTCAHRSLPFGAVLSLVDASTGRAAQCRVNDRGPAKWTGCELDVSRGVARALGFVGRGTTFVIAHRVR